MDNFIIFGAGLSGLICARMLTNAGKKVTVIERNRSLPDNHNALLRFRSPAVSHATGIEFKKVWVEKAVINNTQFIPSNTATLSDRNAYSWRVSGKVTDRSIGNLSPGERYIAPPDFCERLARGLDIKYDMGVEQLNIQHYVEIAKKKEAAVISTIPLPVMLGMYNIPCNMKFRHQEILSVQTRIKDVDVNQTFYFPKPLFATMTTPYRLSMVGDRLIAEYITDENESIRRPRHHTALLADLQLICQNIIHRDVALLTSECKFALMPYGKLTPVDDDSHRKDLILHITELMGIYSLGRFATWRQILLDDVVKDVGVIMNLISSSGYEHRRLYA